VAAKRVAVQNKPPYKVYVLSTLKYNFPIKLPMLDFPIWYKTNFAQRVLRALVLLLVPLVLTLFQTILKPAKVVRKTKQMTIYYLQMKLIMKNEVLDIEFKWSIKCNEYSITDRNRYFIIELKHRACLLFVCFFLSVVIYLFIVVCKIFLYINVIGCECIIVGWSFVDSTTYCMRFLPSFSTST
jgi:hypothetical protein